MFEIKLINPLHQHGHKEWTLIFNDLDGSFPSVRVEKKYSDDATQEQICDDVRITLEAMVVIRSENDVRTTLESMVVIESEDDTPIIVDVTGQILFVDQIGGEVEEWQL
jgi:hypothetical protein